MSGGSNGPLRVVHVASGDLWAGAEAQILGLACAQQEYLAHDVHAVLLNEGTLARRLRRAGVGVAVLPESQHSFPSLLRLLRRHLATLRPDVVHTHRQKENLLGSLANRLSVRAVCVRTAHGAHEHHGGRQALQHRIDVFAARALQEAVIAVSDTLADRLASEFGGTRVHVVRNALDLRPYRAAPEREPSEAPRIGFFGRLVPVKRVDLLLEAFSRIASSTAPTAELHLVGDGPLRAGLEARAATLPGSERIRFHGHMDAPGTLMATMDCVVLCSDHEGTPMAMLEAMALRVPLVAHAVGGMKETLGPTEAAELVERHDATGYAEALARLCADPQRRWLLAERAWDRLQTAHDLGQCVEHCDRIYREAAERRQAP